MSPKSFFSVFLISFVCSVSFYFLKHDGTRMVEQAPELLPDHKPFAKVVKGNTEIFDFQKGVSLSFDFSKERVVQNYEGKLFLEWGDERVATLSLSMQGHRPSVYIRAHFLEDHSIKCLELPQKITERENDYVLLLKNLALDYAYKTNRDENGKYLAQLEVKERNNGFKEITKVKSGYTDPAKKGLKVEKSKHAIKLFHSLLEASGHDSFTLVFNESKSASTHLNYSLKASSEGEPPVLKEFKLSSCTTDFSQQIKMESKVSAQDFTRLMLKLSNSERNARHALMRKTLKALKADPGLLSAYREWINSIKTNQSMAALAVGILANLGTPEAQLELISLYKASNSKTPYLRPQVLNAFTLTSAPLSEESRAFLRSQMKESSPDLAEGAAYALGSSIQNDPRNPESKEDLQFLLQKLEEADTAARKIVYLDAIANSGSMDAYGAIELYTFSDNRFVREKAAWAISNFEAKASSHKD